MTRASLPPPIAHPGFAAASVAFGRQLLPRVSAAVVVLPGSHVFAGRDHRLVHGRYVPTHAAWARDSVPEPMRPLDETPRFAPIAGIDDSGPPRWGAAMG